MMEYDPREAFICPMFGVKAGGYNFHLNISGKNEMSHCPLKKVPPAQRLTGGTSELFTCGRVNLLHEPADA